MCALLLHKSRSIWEFMHFTWDHHQSLIKQFVCFEYLLAGIMGEEPVRIIMSEQLHDSLHRCSKELTCGYLIGNVKLANLLDK